MSYRYLGPIAAFIISTMLAGCVQPLEPGSRSVTTYADGSTEQGFSSVNKWNNKRVLTIKADPVGWWEAIVGDVARTVEAPIIAAAPKNRQRVANSASVTNATRTTSACPTNQCAQPTVQWIEVDADGNVVQ